MKFVLCLLSGVFAIPTALFAQDLDRLAPKVLPKNTSAAERSLPRGAMPSADDARVQVQELKGLIFLRDPAQVKAGGVSGIRGVQAPEIALLQGADFGRRMQGFLGKPVSMKSINELIRSVILFHATHDRPYVNVLLPEQDITSGVLQVLVVEGRVDTVEVTGAKWFRPLAYRQRIRLREGDPIVASTLRGDIEYLNQNAFRSVDVLMAPGREPGTTRLTVQARDRFPLRVYTGVENTGYKSTGEERYLAGFNWGNVFGLDHQFNYQFTTNDDYDGFHAHSGTYIAPLPWRHTLTVFGVIAETRPDFSEDFASKGESSQVSFRYSIPLRELATYSHEIVAGYDFKSTNNNLQFGGDQVFDNTAHVSQFSLGYHAAWPDRFGRTTAALDLIASPGDMTDHNDGESFATIRPGADPSYCYARLGVERLTRLPRDFTLVSRFTGQLTSAALLPTEQLSVGGYSTVRGYRESAANADHGFIMSHELRTPSLPLLRWAGVAKVEDSLQLLAFWDLGLAKLKDAAPGEESSVMLSSIGLGARYAINPYFALRADYGWQLSEVEGDSDAGRFHFGVVVSF